MGYGDPGGVVPCSRRFLWRRRSEGATHHGGKAVKDVNEAFNAHHEYIG